MRKKISLLVLLFGLFLTLLSPLPVQAVDGLTVLNSLVKVDFPSRLLFNLSVKSDANITDIRLHYTVDRKSFAQVVSEVYLEFTPATTIDAEWSWDMRKTGGLPPGSNVEYWWTVQNAKGDKIETKPVRVPFEDTRYAWQSLTEGLLTLYWYRGDTAFARELMVTAQQVLARLAQSTGAKLEKPVKLYIYADAEDLQGGMIFPQEWTGGVTFTRHDTIAIGIAPERLDWGRRAMAHELTHLVINQMTFNPYNDLPTWLDEGLAMYTEGPLLPVFADLLKKVTAENNLITVRSLSSPFSAFAEESALAYAESYRLVELLILNYGQGKMLELLATFRQGSDYDEALVKVYSFDMDGLNSLWRQQIGVEP